MRLKGQICFEIIAIDKRWLSSEQAQQKKKRKLLFSSLTRPLIVPKHGDHSPPGLSWLFSSGSVMTIQSWHLTFSQWEIKFFSPLEGMVMLPHIPRMLKDARHLRESITFNTLTMLGVREHLITIVWMKQFWFTKVKKLAGDHVRKYSETTKLLAWVFGTRTPCS